MPRPIDATAALLTVVVPAYNEVGTLAEVVARIRRTPYRKQIVIVDDGSNDGTGALADALAAQHADILTVHHGENLGKGAAVASALAVATGDIVVIQDADLEYDPRDFAPLLEPIFDGRADVVYGSRLSGGPRRAMYFSHYVGNRMLTFLSNALNNLNLTDMETCYKAFRRDALAAVAIRSRRFGFEPEITAKMARRGAVMYEVPVSYSGRTYADGKKANWRDGVVALGAILWFRFFD